jgi:hypothetical protein
VARLGSQATAALPGLGATMIDVGNDNADADDDIGGADSPASLSSLAVLGAYGLLGRSATALARFWITGDRAAAATAIASLDQATMTLLNAGVVDTFNLVDNLAHVVEDIVAVSPWRRLRDTDRWGDRWRCYLSTRALNRHPLLQVWPSQQAAIDTGLLRAPRSNLLITMPTSAGKTNIAEWAVLDAVGGTENKCAVYIVPTRSLATEAEATLSRSLSRLGLTVSAMFGGLEHVDHELDLLIDSHVVVATSEKLDLLMLIIRSTQLRAEMPGAAGAPGRVSDSDPLQAQAAQVFASELAADRVPPVRSIRARFHVGQPRSQRVRAYLATLISG